MKMAKPSERDLDAAGRLLGLLDTLQATRTMPRAPEVDLQTLVDEDRFDPHNGDHACAALHELHSILRESPGFATRVIGGMAYVICWEANAILDPSATVLELHPDLRAGKALLEQQRMQQSEPAKG